MKYCRMLLKDRAKSKHLHVDFDALEQIRLTLAGTALSGIRTEFFELGQIDSLEVFLGDSLYLLHFQCPRQSLSMQTL